VHLDVDVYCWRVGWGEATILRFPDLGRAHIVDFGTMSRQFNNLYDVVRQTSRILEGYETDAIITHLHCDHYSLIPFVSGSPTLNAVYIPVIPGPSEIRERVCYLLALQDALLTLMHLALMHPGSTLNEIARKSKKVYAVGRGSIIPVGNSRAVYARILWPPPTLPPDLAKRVRKEMERPFEKSKELAKIMQIEEEVEERAQKLKEYFDRITESRENAERLELGEPIEVDRETFMLPAQYTRKVEEVAAQYLALEAQEFLVGLKDALNDMSLVVKYYCGEAALALIPGDNSEAVLNNLYDLEQQELYKRPWARHVVFMRGAHHGSYFGEYLREHIPLCTWLSWTKTLEKRGIPLHYGYLHTPSFVAIANSVDRLHLRARLRCLRPLRTSAYVRLHLSAGHLGGVLSYSR